MKLCQVSVGGMRGRVRSVALVIGVLGMLGHFHRWAQRAGVAVIGRAPSESRKISRTRQLALSRYLRNCNGARAERKLSPAVNLFNSTPIVARAMVNPGPHDGGRGIGALTAKATFRFSSRGQVELDAQSPFPLFAKDLETPLGPLPAERMAHRGRKFEVMLLGYAYAPQGRPVGELAVGLEVGDERREMVVSGDRFWVTGRGQAPALTRPVPFERMPLGYERSFGGTCQVQIDAQTVVDVFDPINRRGRGFDAQAWARSLAALLGAPAGYPKLIDERRTAPNLEHPNARISSWDDAPEPVGWAPAYPDIGVQHLATLRRESAKARARELRGGAAEPPTALAQPEPNADPDAAQYRAHSDLVLKLPVAGARVRLENLLPDAPVLELPLPRLRVIADYVIYGRQGERELRPYALVVLPEARAFYLCYGTTFTFERGPAKERAFRLRTASGWFQPGEA